MLKYFEWFRPSLLVTCIVILILSLAFSGESVVSSKRQVNRLIKEYKQKGIRIPSRNQFVNRRYYEKYLNRGRHFKFYEIRSRSKKYRRRYKYDVAIFNINDKLEAVRTKLYGHRLIVNSGYRNPKHNAYVGGVKRSRHMYGNAVDIRIEDFDRNGVINRKDGRKLCKIAREEGANFAKTYCNKKGYCSHVHLDWR